MVRNSLNRPFTRKDMLGTGYVYQGTTKCSGCGKLVEKWITWPNKKHVLYDVEPAGENAEATCHFGTCEKRRKATQAPAAPARGRAALDLDAEAIRIAQSLGVRMVVIVSDRVDPHVAWKNGEDGHDLRQACIAAGNRALAALEVRR